MKTRIHRFEDGLRVEALRSARAETRWFRREIFEEQLYLRHGLGITPGDVVFDLGANIGLFSLFVATRFSGARVFAYEPLPPNLELLRRNLERNSAEGVTVVPRGVADQPGRRTFEFWPQTPGNSTYLPAEKLHNRLDGPLLVELFLAFLRRQNRFLYHAAAWCPGKARLASWALARHVASTQRYDCEVTTISHALDELDVERIDLLKVDVEGAERDVLEGIGAGDWSRIRQIVLEVDGVPRLGWIREQLAARGFDVEIEQQDWELTDDWQAPLDFGELATHLVYARRP